ncbi:undecaprenyl-diphosphatase [Fructobacillus pseudoficulneus]|uniref:Undecaprenyl-diphosphatase n=1 Tax=Fructobacillus pseudoficulneus TaxID=220714 RepID=A0A3F3GVJ1_9LACO|nr:undecaprenyl-diphosphate phosphatase [Fructobacillus pseudoficulneus]GAP02884.1 undecaprenyl-diphosphatase [Fructobacillus pseudoficulneus]SEH45428.1 undecaprenyl-diphosphatase [Fructobacillus pseudoficulneus]
MLDIFRAIIIGIVEGITEFLPISSTGHIDLVSQFVQISQGKAFEDMFEYVIQFGAIMAVVILYFSKLNPFSFRKSSQEKKDTWTLWFKVIVACIPSIVIGLPLNNFMDEHLHKPVVVASALIIYGIFFIIIENIYKNKTPKVTSLASIGYNTALYIGLFQALSIVPGTSRSGATILGAIILGASRYVATEFSFFLAIPTMFGVTILKVGSYLLKGHTFTGEQWAVLATGTFVSFIIAVVAIKWLLKFVQTHDFKPFGWYRIVVGIIVLIAMVWL